MFLCIRSPPNNLLRVQSPQGRVFFNVRFCDSDEVCCVSHFEASMVSTILASKCSRSARVARVTAGLDAAPGLEPAACHAILARI